jgi:hypothetical protein
MIEELSVQFPIKECCVALSVSRSGYYQWEGTEQSVGAEADAELSKQIRRVYDEHKGRTVVRGLPSSFGRRAWCVGRIGWRG